MKRFLIAFLLLSFVCVQAQEPVEAPPAPPETPSQDYNDTVFGVAVALSQSVSSTTGIAMSPLLGMGVLGAWKYFQADEITRAALPWYSLPWVWGICIGVFALLKSKDILGAWVPEMVKKPITVLDDIQEKASALIVGLAVIPMAVYQDFKDVNPAPIFGRGGDDVTLAVAPVIFPIMMVVLSVIVFAVVWMAFNAFSSIKVFSPSSMINTGISVVKGGILGLYAIILAINPFVALGVALLLLVFCIMIAGWAFRWNVFGILFVKDFLKGANQEKLGEREKLKGFTTGNFPELPARTYGEMKRDGDELVFSYSPWLFGLKRKKKIDLSSCDSNVRKGIFVPAITVKDVDSDRQRSIFDFRLRYRGYHDEIRERLALNEVLPNPVLTGLNASWLWVKDQMRRGGSALSQSLT